MANQFLCTSKSVLWYKLKRQSFSRHIPANSLRLKGSFQLELDANLMKQTNYVYLYLREPMNGIANCKLRMQQTKPKQIFYGVRISENNCEK